MIRKMIEDKRNYRRWRRRVDRLPPRFRTSVKALEQYFYVVGPSSEWRAVFPLLKDLLELFETSAANRTPLHDVVGDDPVEFAETFVCNYPGSGWMAKERDKLRTAIHRASTEGAR